MILIALANAVNCVSRCSQLYCPIQLAVLTYKLVVSPYTVRCTSPPDFFLPVFAQISVGETEVMIAEEAAVGGEW